MAISSGTLSSILRVKKEFNLETGDLDLTQLTDFAGYGIIAPDTAKTLLKVIDPTGATLYINTGFDTDDYTSPDFTLVTTTKALTMPADINGNYLTGVYTIYMKCEVVDDGDTVDGSATTTSNVCDCSVTVSIELEADYATAVLTSTDTTNYGAYYAISRTHTIYPPPISGLPNQTTSATTNVYSNIVTTTWSSKVLTDITYLYANDTYVTCEVVGSKEINVEADTLCKTLCLIKKFRTDFYSKYGKKSTEDMEETYQLAVNEFALAMQASRCGQNIDTYINKIYELTGLDPDCDCGCGGDFPTPVVPTSIINGTDGADGVTPQFQNTGTWIQVSYDNGLTWNNLFSLASVTGAAGANGTNGTDGADGVAVLDNDIQDDTTAGTAWETLKTYSLPSGQLSSDGDMAEIIFRFKADGAISGQEARIQFKGSTLISAQMDSTSRISTFWGKIQIIRTGNTTAKYLVEWKVGTDFFGAFSIGRYLFRSYTGDISGVDFTTTAYDINADGKSVVIGDIISESLQVIYYKK